MKKRTDKGYSDREAIAMVTSRRLLFFYLVIILVTRAQASAQQIGFLYEYCQNEKGNYTTNSTYRANLKRVMSILTSTEGNGNGNGFYTASYGENSDQVSAIGLCMGDVEPQVCHSCLNQSTQLLTQTCPNQKEAIGAYDDCMLHYSNHSLISLMETHPKFHSWNTQNVSFIYMDSFSQDLKPLLENLKTRAAYGASLCKYVVGNASAVDFQTLYALARCMPDLSKTDCNNCLIEAFGVPQHNLSMGGGVFTRSYNFRYEVYPFYGRADASQLSQQQSTPASPSATTANKKTRKGKKSKKSRTIFIAVVLSVTSLILIISLGVYSRVKKKPTDKRESQDPPSYEADDQEIERATRSSLQFHISTLIAATNNFSNKNKIAEAQFGDLYKGRLSDGQDIAVKRFKRNSPRISFLNEILFSAKVQHRNIVRLLGFCLKGDDHIRGFLIYEFLPMSLHRLIFVDPVQTKQTCLDWDRRYKIVRGIAGGLLYLHKGYHSTIIHHDIKASNILLDENMNPKISGFDLARFVDVDESEVDTCIIGSCGYIDPEYIWHGTVSTKSDVFSFGVLLLEIVTGQNRRERMSHQSEDPLSYVRRNYMEGTISNVVDPLMKDGSDDSEIKRCIHIGLLCTETNRDARPTMSSVVHMLDCCSHSLPVLSNIITPDAGSSSSPDLFSQGTESDDDRDHTVSGV